MTEMTMKINLQMMDLQTLTLTEPLRLSLLDLLLLTSQFHLLFEIEITSPCSQEVNSSSSFHSSNPCSSYLAPIRRIQKVQ